METVKDRLEIPQQYQWSLEAMYATDEDWETEFAACKKEVAADPFAPYRGHLGEGAALLAKLYAQEQVLSERIYRLHMYAHTKNDQDTRVAKYQAMMAQIEALGAQYGEKGSFIEPELLALPEQTLQSYLKSPELADYRHGLDDLLRSKPHVLSAESEALLASLSDSLGGARKIFGQLTNADFDFGSFTIDGQEYAVSSGRYGLLMRNPDERVRKAAYESMYDTFLAHKNALAAMYATSVTKDIAVARAKRFPTTRAARLFSDHIPETVYDALVEGVRKNVSHLHRYLELRRKVLKLSGVRMYDKYVALAELPDNDYPFEQGFALVQKGLSSLGDEYVSILNKAREERWIDVFENPGKRSGAYSTGFYGTRPYILLNYQGNFDSVSTLAHELGHSVHSYLAAQAQPPQYSGYSIFLAEIASTVNETLLINHLLDQTTDKQVRAALLNEQIDSLTGTIYRQTMFAEFEYLAHKMVEEGTALTHESLCEMYGDLNRYYHGSAYVDDERASAEWSRIPHFYGAYYVFKYATGMSAALVFADRIRKEGAPAIDKYLGFLRSGSSDYPLAVLQKAGLDMTDPGIVTQALSIYGNLVEELESLLV